MSQADPGAIRSQQTDPHPMTAAELAAPEGEFFCPRCHAVWFKKSWHTDERRFTELAASPQHAHLARTCPACRKETHDLPEGILTLTGIDGWSKQQREELLGLVRNVGDRARKRDPMDRVMKILDRGVELLVYTTENQLAVAIGNEVKRARGGDLNVDFGNRDNEVARVVWIAKAA